MNFKKTLLFTVLALALSVSANGTELDFNNIHEILQKNKEEIKDCGVQVKSKGKKINPLPKNAPNGDFAFNLGDNYFNINEQECSIENGDENHTLVCKYNKAENQSIRIAGVYLQIKFDENGEFLELAKRYSTGVTFIVKPDGDIRQACKNGEEPRKVDKAFFYK